MLTVGAVALTCVAVIITDYEVLGLASGVFSGLFDSLAFAWFGF